jgi:hypothetical protein
MPSGVLSILLGRRRDRRRQQVLSAGWREEGTPTPVLGFIQLR